MKEYLELLESYIDDVLSGEIVANTAVVEAVDRHLDDLDRIETDPSFPFFFDEGLAAWACGVLETFPHIKGRWAGTLLELEPWQIFIVASLFGWVRPDGTRRFRKSSLYVARKNAKSTLAAAIGNLMFGPDGEPGAEVYAGATNKKQAHEVFGPARLMAKQTPGYVQEFGIEVAATSLSRMGDASKWEPIIGKPGDGASPHCGIVDEFHEHKTSVVVDTFITGMGARTQPLLLIISTAGESIEGPCFDDVLDCRELLSGAFDDEEHFAIIFEADAEDEWGSDIALEKANPNLDVSVSLDFLEARRQEALRNPRKASRYKTKHLNLWVTAKDAFYDLDKWMQLGDSALSLKHFAGRQCFVGVDVASKIDLTALQFIFPIGDDLEEPESWISIGRYYVPDAQLEEKKNEHYRKWEAAGHLIATDGDMIDLPRIRDELVDLSSVFEIRAVGYDPHQATMFVTELQDEGVPCVEVRQTVLALSDPMKETDALIRAGRIRHDGNPCMVWQMGNVVAKEDAKENVYPRKLRKEKKIDGPLAQIIAFALTNMEIEGGPSVYNERGLLSIGDDG